MTLDELKSSLWGAAVLLRGKINATGYKEYIFPLVFFKRISDVHEEEYKKALELADGDEDFAKQPENYSFAIPDKCLWRDIREVTENVGQALVTAWTRIEQANPNRVVGGRVVEGLGGIFGKRDHWTNKNILKDETISELIEHFSKIDLSLASCPADEMGNAYEYLVGQFADDAGNTAQEFYTNRTVVELMAEILEPKAGESIYDPTCGTGGMLISCIARCKTRGSTAPHPENWREIKAYGQEQNALTSSVARMNLFLHGVEEFRIINDDTLLRPGFLEAGKLKTFDVVLANPPYSIKQWNRDLFAHDPFGRNFLGLPPQGRADYAFIQHILKSMNPKTGRCAILLPHGVLFREEEKHIRKALIESDLVEAVIGLAPNLFYNSPMEACVMVCRTKKFKKAKGRILFINAVGEVTRKNAESKLEAGHIEKILKAYRERTSDGVFAYDATLEEIAAKDWSLAISLYAHVGAGLSGSAETQSLEDALIHQMLSSDDAKKQLEELGGAINDGVLIESHVHPQIPKVNIPHQSEGSRVRLGEVAEEVRGNWAGETKDVPVVGLEHLDPDDIWLRKWEVNPSENTFTKAFRKGQILFGRRRAYQKKLSLAPRDGICSGDITVIAAKGDKVFPELLPFFLRTDKFFDYAIQGSAGSLSPRVKWAHLANYEFDLPSIARQRELSNLLWAANDLKESYKKAIAATDEMLKAKFREMFGECGGQKAEGDPKVAIWPLATIGDVSESVRYGTSKPGDTNGDYKYLRMNNLTYDGYFDFSDVKRISLDADEIDKYIVHRGDILFNRTNTKEIVGKTAYFDFDEHMVIAGYIIRLRVDKRRICPQYLWKLLNTNELKGKLRKMAKGAIHQANINAQELRSIEFPLPPLSLQREFVAIAERADAAKSALKQSIADIDQVMKGLING
jgi:type I restriction enzyme M protein